MAFGQNEKKKKEEKKKHKSLEEGLEPSTLWLTATRSNQLSYSSCCSFSQKFIKLKITIHIVTFTSSCKIMFNK